jgi:hypothetical protein
VRRHPRPSALRQVGSVETALRTWLGTCARTLWDRVRNLCKLSLGCVRGYLLHRYRLLSWTGSVSIHDCVPTLTNVCPNEDERGKPGAKAKGKIKRWILAWRSSMKRFKKSGIH